MQISKFLKRVLAADAASCLAMAALLAAGAPPLAAAFGLPPDLLFWAALALVPIGLFILWTATRREAPAAFLYLIVGGNLLWVVESLLLVRGAPEITGTGIAFVGAQAFAVAVLTLLEIVGIVRARARPAAAGQPA